MDAETYSRIVERAGQGLAVITGIGAIIFFGVIIAIALTGGL